MSRVLVIPIACAALLCVTGCGTSESTTSPQSTATTSATSSTTPKSSGLKVVTTPKFASPPANAPVQSGLVRITYKEFTIEPDTLKAKVGSTLRWTNENTEKCDVKSEGGPYQFDSGNLAPEGGTFELKLDKPGTIHYECTSYPTTMNGTIEVLS